MSSTGWFLLGVAAGFVVITRLVPADPSSCCQRVAFGARDKIAGYAGPFSGLVSGALDGLGLTPLIPGLLDTFGVPKDA